MGALTGKRALVTCGSRGIGRAVVERLARDGAAVVFSLGEHGPPPTRLSRPSRLRAEGVGRSGRPRRPGGPCGDCSRRPDGAWAPSTSRSTKRGRAADAHRSDDRGGVRPRRAVTPRACSSPSGTPARGRADRRHVDVATVRPTPARRSTAPARRRSSSGSRWCWRSLSRPCWLWRCAGWLLADCWQFSTPTPQRHRPIGLARGTRTGGAVLSSEDLGREYCAI
jgi:hypothetical protein